jgi:hypothetical protein
MVARLPVLGSPRSGFENSSHAYRPARIVQLGNLLGARLAQRFGLEGVSFEAEEGRESASVVLGRYLFSRLYVAYAVGLFESLNTFRVCYLMNDHWSLVGESGTETSADLVYPIQRGRRGTRTVPEADEWEVESRTVEAPAADGER